MARELERHCAKLVSEVLGDTKYFEGKRFSFLRGDPTPHYPEGMQLPVDAYFPEYKLVLEFRESQHYKERVRFWDERVTATGEKRREQRLKYDRRREEILPANGIKLLIIYDYEIQDKNREEYLAMIKQKLKANSIIQI